MVMRASASTSRRIELICPDCRSRNTVTLWERVDAHDVELVSRIMDGSLFDFHCRVCDNPIPGDHSIDFIDRNLKLFVRYQAPGDAGQSAGWAAAIGEGEVPGEYLLLRAEDQASFIELVHVWNAGLDVAGMLILKHQLAAQITHDAESEPLVCSFDLQDDQGNLQYILIMKESARPETVTFSADVLKGVLERFQSDIPVLFQRGQWVDWNAETVRRFWKRHAAGA